MASAEEGDNTQSQNNKVILHQFDKYGRAPCFSPPCLKLETYLRMANISYEDCRGIKVSSKGKMPWIEYKGQEIADSNFIIDFLNKEFNVDLDKDLTSEQKAVSLSMKRMVEENTYWTVVYYRWIDDYNFTKNITFSSFELVNILGRKRFQSNLRGQLHGHGIGRHSRDEIYQIARDDLNALSVYLGTKEFMMGDKPSLIDLSVFGLIVQFAWVNFGSPHEKMVKEDFPNLEQLCVRIKEKFWPDWDEVIKITKE